MSFKETFPIYRKGTIIILVMLVSIFLSSIYLLAYPEKLQTGIWQILANGFIPTIVIWGGCHFIVSGLWKKFPWEQHPIKHLIYEVIFILLYLTLFFIWQLLMVAKTDFCLWGQLLSERVLEIFNTVLITFLITAIHEAYYFYKQWQANFSKSVSLEKDNLQAQYNTLKAQINPHFLFNSLNSLISLMENNPKAEKFVQDLSEFLRFVLLSSDKETVTLNEEIENLDKYIRLMFLRFGENLTVTFNTKEEALQQEVPPLVLQILVENCVKHNIITQAKPLHISIEANEDKVTVTNNLQKKPDSGSTGQGLSNIKGRYRFASANEVEIIETENTFSVSIPLIKQKI